MNDTNTNQSRWKKLSSDAAIGAAIGGFFTVLAAFIQSGLGSVSNKVPEHEPPPASSPTPSPTPSTLPTVTSNEPKINIWSNLPPKEDRHNWRIFVRSCHDHLNYLKSTEVLSDIGFDQIVNKDMAKEIDNPFEGFSSFDTVIYYDAFYQQAATAIGIILTKSLKKKFYVSKGDHEISEADSNKKLVIHLRGSECRESDS